MTGICTWEGFIHTTQNALRNSYAIVRSLKNLKKEGNKYAWKRNVLLSNSFSSWHGKVYGKKGV